MKTLWLLPIEPIAERYTKEWYDFMPSLFEGYGFFVRTIEGGATSGTIKTGSFLDANETVAYKANQLSLIAQLFGSGQVKNGDTFFVYDIEFWGIEVLRVLARMNRVSVRLVGFLHACSYTVGDAMEQMADFQAHTERGWFEAFDTIVVGSLYQKQRLMDARGVASDKIEVTGNPLFPGAYPRMLAPSFEYKEREKLLVIANRFDAEKNPDESLAWALLAQSLYGYKVVVTTSRRDLNSNSTEVQDMAESLEGRGLLTILRGQTKAQYHELLTRARIVLTNSEEESFGYCIHEAQLHGAIVIAKPYACHPEFIHPDLLVTSAAEFCECVGLLEISSRVKYLAENAHKYAMQRMEHTLTQLIHEVVG